MAFCQGSTHNEMSFCSPSGGRFKRSIDDSTLSAKLNDLSMEERSMCLDDLHGIPDFVKESPEMLKEKLQAMRRDLISAIATRGGDGSFPYRTAVEMSPTYVDGLQLRFLRAEDYNSKLAANRMIDFFNQKLNLFGKDKLVKEIGLDDLDQDSRDALQEGIVQALPIRDRAGRIIFFGHGAVSIKYEARACLQAFFYTVMSGMQDEISQRRGCILLWYGIGQSTFVNRTAVYWRLGTAVPLRFAALHACTDNPALAPMRWVLSKVLESKPLCRFRFHFGTQVECIYQLLTFGITRDAIPILDDGSIDLSNHHKLLALLHFKEQESAEAVPRLNLSISSSSSSLQKLRCSSPNTMAPTKADGKNEGLILIPSPMDVLMGRGRQPRSRPGALRMHQLLTKNRDTYEATNRKFEKTAIAEQILMEMKASGCRFLREVDGGGYVEIDDSTARAKIAHGFRNLRRHTNKANRLPRAHMQELQNASE